MDDKKRLNIAAIKNILRQALAEDIGREDATTAALIPDQLQVTGYLQTRESCIIAGLPVFIGVFNELSPSIDIECMNKDGQSCQAGTNIAKVTGPANNILTGERTALNYIQRLSGIATLTNNYVKALGNSKTKILDTRKTTPGLRLLEKYAVSMGGGINHRMGLYDRIMIKDNHLSLLSHSGQCGIKRSVERCRQKYPDLEIEVEVDTLNQLSEALEAGVDIILLDNMSTTEMIEAVKLRDNHFSQTLLEASGNMTLERIPDISNIGLDCISVGSITHSFRSIDMGLDFHPTLNYPASSE